MNDTKVEYNVNDKTTTAKTLMFPRFITHEAGDCKDEADSPENFKLHGIL